MSPLDPDQIIADARKARMPEAKRPADPSAALARALRTEGVAVDPSLLTDYILPALRDLGYEVRRIDEGDCPRD